MNSLALSCTKAIATAVVRAQRWDEPFRHWSLTDVLPAEVLAHLVELDLAAPDLAGGSGSREIHNDQRLYLDAPRIAADPICAGVAEAFQSRAVTSLVEATTGARLGGCHLRLEYALDVSGFWLKPHTDLGVKRYTLLLYLDGSGPDLGTDLYRNAETWAARLPFQANGGVSFVPGADTWHGFEARQIEGVRRSLIVNYVDEAWRAREQLAFPDSPVTGLAR